LAKKLEKANSIDGTQSSNPWFSIVLH